MKAQKFKIGNIVKVVEPYAEFEGFTEEMRFEVLFIEEEQHELIVKLFDADCTGIYILKTEEVKLA